MEARPGAEWIVLSLDCLPFLLGKIKFALTHFEPLSFRTFSSSHKPDSNAWFEPIRELWRLTDFVWKMLWLELHPQPGYPFAWRSVWFRQSIFDTNILRLTLVSSHLPLIGYQIKIEFKIITSALSSLLRWFDVPCRPLFFLRFLRFFLISLRMGAAVELCSVSLSSSFTSLSDNDCWN